LKEAQTKLKKMNKEASAIEVELTKKSTLYTETVINKRQEYASTIQEKEAKITQTKMTLEENSTTLEEEETRLKALEDQLAEKNVALSGLLEDKKSIVSELSQLKLNISQYSNDLHPLQMKLNTIQLKTSEMETKISEWRCQISPDVDVPADVLTHSETELQSILEHIEQEKASLGPVNLKAIEKFNEIDTRFHELEAKNEQIIDERESILQFIEALETEKKKVFMNTYNNINKNFGYIFSRLSPKGEAKLELDNLEDPFSGGVEILARPGEKKWCLTQAMSGGEKSLTILALILGIQMHVPSPYYVLDEVDAALDDANGAQVADLIKELSNRSQFVVITHRDVTMARADQLLGVSNREGLTSVINLSIKNVLEQLAKEKSESEQPIQA
jgi:chromosome segregation protein